MRTRIAVLMSILLATAFWLVSSGFIVSHTDRYLERFFVARVADISHLYLHKDIPKTSLVFNLEEGDSLKINCASCVQLVNEGNLKGGLKVQIMSAEGIVDLKGSDFGKWIKGANSKGRIAIAFVRDGYGERLLDLPNLAIYLKISQVYEYAAGRATPLLRINNLFLNSIDPISNSNQTTFWLPLKEEDQYQVKISGANISGQIPVLGNVYRSGEEFAKEPMVFETPTHVPALGHANSRFGFEMFETKAAKGLNIYHLDIDRIPLQSFGGLSTLGK